MTIGRAWLLATIPSFLIAVVAVVKLALGLARSNRESVIAALPFVAEQRVNIPSEGRYSVFFEGKLGQRGMAGLRLTVAREADGGEVHVSPVVLRTTSTSLAGTTRLELFAFSAGPGAHIVRLVGIDPAGDHARNRVLVARQMRGRLLLSIVGLVLAGAITVASLVASILLLVRR